MDDVVPAVVVELVELVGWALGTVLFSATGLRLEGFAAEAVTTGHLAMGAWYLGVGAIALYAGVYLMGYGELLPRLRDRDATGGEKTE